MEAKVYSVVTINEVVVHVTGGDSVEEITGVLTKAIELLAESKVEHVAEEE